MKKIGTAACVFLLVSAAPASAQQWSRTTTGIVTLSVPWCTTPLRAESLP